MKKTRDKSKHKPPSRIRYEKSHPVVSFRIKKEWYDELKTFLENRGITIADFFQIALKKQTEDYENAKTESYDFGVRDGAKFDLPCCECGEPMCFSLDEPEVKKVLEEAFKNWRHINCREKEDQIGNI